METYAVNDGRRPAKGNIMDETQVPFDTRTGERPANTDRRALRVVGNALSTIAFAALCVTSVATGLCIGLVWSSGPNAFGWAGVSNWMILLLALTAMLTAIGLGLCRQRWIAVILALVAVLAACIAVNGMRDWEADRASGPSDATAEVVSFVEHRDDDGSSVNWSIKVRLPDGAEREWMLDERPDPKPRPGGSVDITYYPRTNVLASLDPNG